MKYAVIRLNGKQYKVQEGDEILVNYLNNKEPKADVLLLKEDNNSQVGTPIVEKIAVKMTVLKEEEKGKKLSIFKYKAKSRYRKKVGFRPKFTRIKIEKIN